MVALFGAKQLGQTERAARILESVSLAIEFQLKTQIVNPQQKELKNPMRALGGFRKDMASFEVRNDYVQHNLSSLIAFHRAIDRH